MIKNATCIVCLFFCAFAVQAQESAFLNPPEYIGLAKAFHSTTNRAFQGIPSIAISPGGRLWATWYAGPTPKEDRNNYVVLSTSADNGKSWQEVLVIDPDEDGPVRAFDPELWFAPDGNLYLFWAQHIKYYGTAAGVWALKITNPEEGSPQYGQPKRLTDGVMMCKPIILSSGEWVLPASTWLEPSSARMVVSLDQGKTWTVRGGCDVPKDAQTVDEHILIERKDGTLWMLARTKYGMGESISTNRGITWPELKPASIVHSSSRFFIQRLNSGNLLLVKHGLGNSGKIGRSHLTAFISTDDGKTWGGGLLLDERKISYPDGQQSADGLIHIIYDHGRYGAGDIHILMATFREEDAAAGTPVSGDVQLKQIVSDATKKVSVQ